MPGPGRLVRAAVGLPLGIARRAAGIALRAVPGLGDAAPEPDMTPPAASPPAAEPAAHPDVDPDAAAEAALGREREPIEEPAVVVDEPPPEPVDSEDEVVAESADVEATEPPGPQFHVDEPWEGYRRMRASEITARLEGQPSEVLAAVELYESAHRGRQTVLDAVRAIRA